MKKFFAKVFAKQYKIIDPEYRKYWKQAMLTFIGTVIVMVIIYSILSVFLGDTDFSAKQKIWIMFGWVFMVAAGYCIGGANAIESADKYQAKKDKKNDEIPTV